MYGVTYHAFNIFWLLSIFWTLYWELLGAPLRPGGSWLVLKALCLVFFWRHALNRNWRGLQWWALLGSFFIAEAVMRAWSDPMIHQRTHAWIAAFFLCMTYILNLILFYMKKHQK
jgi:uncharacterized membrane protein